MEMKIYSIRDAKAQSFGNPWYKNTHGEAERDFRTAVNDEKSFLNKYPEDYDLYYLGVFDTDTGKVESLATPEHQIKAIQCVERPLTPAEELRINPPKKLNRATRRGK